MSKKIQDLIKLIVDILDDIESEYSTLEECVAEKDGDILKLEEELEEARQG